MELKAGDKVKDLEATVVFSDGWIGEESKRRQKLTLDIKGQRLPFTNWPNTGIDLKVGDEIKLARAELGLYQGNLQVYLPRGAPIEIVGKADVEEIEEDNWDISKKDVEESLKLAANMLPDFVEVDKLSAWELGDLLHRLGFTINKGRMK